MVAILKYGRQISWGLLSVVVLVAMWQIFAAVSHVATYVITCDSSFSSTVDNAIHILVGDRINSSGRFIYKILKEEFPFVESLQLRKVGLNKVHVQVGAPDLAWQVGDNFVLTNKGEAYLSSCFDAGLIQQLPKINLMTRVEFSTDISSELRQFLLELPESIREEYELAWSSPNNIMLVNRKNSKQQIVVRFDQLLTIQILQTCQQLFLKYDQQAKKPCQGIIKADIRFADQVVLSC